MVSAKERTLIWQCGDRRRVFDRGPLLMGILNVTPDSFSDGGSWATFDAAVRQGQRLAQEGADVIDVGGESTRPGAEPVSEAEECRRIIPVIRALAGAIPAVLSVDTTKASVAAEALKTGARIINDVSALRHDPAMADVAVSAGAGVALMHMLGTPGTMQLDPRYDDVVSEVAAFLTERLQAAGLEQNALAVDPGIGFGKTVEHNLRLLANLEALARMGRPVILGLSRKSFIGRLTGAKTDERLAGSLAGLVYGALHGAAVLRVHDVRASRQALDVALAIAREREQ